MRAAELVQNRPTLDGVIYDEVRKRIISLAYDPGVMISENALAQEFGVSRTPVRQAFFRLAHEGLLVVEPQRGARISMLSRVKILEAQQIRECLERQAFGQVARNWNPDNPAHMAARKAVTALINQQREAVANGDYLTFTQSDEAWHSQIIRLAGNMTLLSVVNDMRLHLNRLRFLELQEARHEAEAICFHERIFAAIERGDENCAVAELTAHLKVLEDFRGEIFERHKDKFA